MGRPVPEPDRSKWTAKISVAKPPNPDDVLAVARAIRADADLWQIFLRLNPDDWISEQDAARINEFTLQFLKRTSRKSTGTNGQEKVLLRGLAEGKLSNLDDDATLVSFLRATFPSG